MNWKDNHPSIAGNISYVYIHKRKDTNEPFYVGIGSKPKFFRAYELGKRSKHWKAIVKKHGLDVEIYSHENSWEEACAIERELILRFGRLDNKTGILINLTDGGEGAWGVIMSEETKIKIKKGKIGVKRPPITEQARANLSAAMKGRKPKNFSYLHSPEVAKRRIASLKGTKTPETIEKLKKQFTGSNNPRSRMVLDNQYGVFYDNLKDVQQVYGKSMQHSIWSMMLSGKRKNKTNYQYA